MVVLDNIFSNISAD